MGHGELPCRKAFGAWFVLVLLGATAAQANPLVARRTARETADASAVAESSGLNESSRPVAESDDLSPLLPLPEIGAPIVNPEGPDPRIAFLPSDHSSQRNRANLQEQSIHIPEPASVVLLATGAIGLLARRALRRGQG